MQQGAGSKPGGKPGSKPGRSQAARSLPPRRFAPSALAAAPGSQGRCPAARQQRGCANRIERRRDVLASAALTPHRASADSRAPMLPARGRWDRGPQDRLVSRAVPPRVLGPRIGRSR